MPKNQTNKNVFPLLKKVWLFKNPSPIRLDQSTHKQETLYNFYVNFLGVHNEIIFLWTETD